MRPANRPEGFPADAALPGGGRNRLKQPRPEEGADPQFRVDVLRGLVGFDRRLPARWFYDRRGSELFEEITALPEYYPTRTEVQILEQAASSIAQRVGPGRSVIEFGSGSSTKTPILLSAIAPSVYVPIDISGDFLEASSAALGRRFPELPIRAVAGDFTRPLVLPDEINRRPRLGFFPGSTLGNFDPGEAVDLLRSMAATLGQDAMLLIGLDQIKDPAVLGPAYNDAAGVTAAFNLNLLHRINRELSATIPVDAFEHHAFWNDDCARIEMHLRATRDVSFTVESQSFVMNAGETIHTENSHKYGRREAGLLLRAGGWTPVAQWSDEKGWFSVILASEGCGSRASAGEVRANNLL
jgi:L-histidine N-alpha-methyltransferase